MRRLSIKAQSIIEYMIILIVVAVISLIFAKNFLYDKDGKFKLFIGYVRNASKAMRE